MQVSMRRIARQGPAEHQLRREPHFSVIVKIACWLLKWFYFLLRCFAGEKKLENQPSKLLPPPKMSRDEDIIISWNILATMNNLSLIVRGHQTNPNWWAFYQITRSTLQKHQPQKTDILRNCSGFKEAKEM